MPRAFLSVVILLWLAGPIAGFAYAERLHLSVPIAVAAGAAVLLEATFYATLASGQTRRWWTPLRVTILAPVPYLTYSLPAGVFDWRSVCVIMAGVAILSWWFRQPSRGSWVLLLFFVIYAAPLVTKAMPAFYARPFESLRIDILGQLLWIRAGILAALQNPFVVVKDFGFWPDRRQWREGALWFLCAMPVLIAGIFLTGFAAPFVRAGDPLETAGLATLTFLGILWVVALHEEFFFRGVLQTWIVEKSGSAIAAIAVASLLFGSVHLGFRQFPNWKMAGLAAAAGVFYGLSFRRGGLRAAMVTHALVVTAWRTFFR